MILRSVSQEVGEAVGEAGDSLGVIEALVGGGVIAGGDYFLDLARAERGILPGSVHLRSDRSVKRVMYIVGFGLGQAARSQQRVRGSDRGIGLHNDLVVLLRRVSFNFPLRKRADGKDRDDHQRRKEQGEQSFLHRHSSLICLKWKKMGLVLDASSFNMIARKSEKHKPFPLFFFTKKRAFPAVNIS